VTKRAILSRVAQLFSPLGLLGPVIVQVKLILQELWKCQVEWDDAVPSNIRVAWLKFQDQLEKIHQVTIPRQVTIHKSVTLQVYGFADASERAYRACIYLRSTDSQNRYWSHLLCSKSRVGPLEMQSLPRWELCAAVLVIKLFSSVTKTLNLHRTFLKLLLQIK
jgi:hypothetical protein